MIVQQISVTGCNGFIYWYLIIRLADKVPELFYSFSRINQSEDSYHWYFVLNQYEVQNLNIYDVVESILILDFGR